MQYFISSPVVVPVYGLAAAAAAAAAMSSSWLVQLKFSWPDYAVFAASLAIPLGIGLFFCMHRRHGQHSIDSFLVGDHSLNVGAVGVSLLGPSVVIPLTTLNTTTILFCF